MINQEATNSLVIELFLRFGELLNSDQGTHWWVSNASIEPLEDTKVSSKIYCNHFIQTKWLQNILLMHRSSIYKIVGQNSACILIGNHDYVYYVTSAANLVTNKCKNAKYEVVNKNCNFTAMTIARKTLKTNIPKPTKYTEARSK